MNLSLKTNEMEKRIDRKKSTSPMKWILRDIRSPHSEFAAAHSHQNDGRIVVDLQCSSRSYKMMQRNTESWFQSDIDWFCAVSIRLQCEVLYQEHSAHIEMECLMEKNKNRNLFACACCAKGRDRRTHTQWEKSRMFFFFKKKWHLTEKRLKKQPKRKMSHSFVRLE